MKRAFSYVRFSRLHQQDGDSIRRQTTATEEYCRRNKLVLDDSLSLKDHGVSAFRGRNAEKGALSRFIAACEEGLIPRGSALVMESLDRMSRQSPRKTVSLLTQLLDEHGIEVHLTMANKVFLPENQDGVDLIFAVALAMRAHEESETKSKRLSEAFAEKRSTIMAGEKIIMTKSLPWWLILDDKGKIVCPADRKKIVKRIFKEAAEGASSNAIAWGLNADNTPTWRPKTKHWIDSRVRDLIKSDAVIGTFSETPKTKAAGREWSIPDYYPKVITEMEIVAAARATLVENRTSGRPKNTDGPANILKSIGRYRGIWLRFSSRRNGIGWNGYYDALNVGRSGLAFSISANQLEGVLLTALAELEPDELEPKSEVKDRVANLKKTVRELQEKIANISTAIEAGSTSMVARLIVIEAEFEKTKRLLVEAEAQRPVKADAGALAQLKQFPLEDLKEIEKRPAIAFAIRRLIARVDVGKNLADLLEGESDNVLHLEDGDTVIEQELEDPTGSRGKNPLAMLVHFHGGGKRAILRGTDECPNCILTVRVVSAGHALPQPM